MAKQKRGFAAMSPERRKALQSRGGKKAKQNGTLHRFTVEECRKAGLVSSAKRGSKQMQAVRKGEKDSDDEDDD